MVSTLLPRHIGPFDVFPIGLGCMSLSISYGTPPSEHQSEGVLRAALEAGVTLFDTAGAYGNGANERLVGRVLKPHRERVVLATKGGLHVQLTPDGQKRLIDGRPSAIRRDVELSLSRIGTDVIDLFYLHRLDRAVPVEESVGELSRLVAEGKLRTIGLSEVSAATLRRAHAVHPIAAVQSEYSIWTRNPEIGVRDACSELGVALVAFSPVGRGYLTDAPPDPQSLPTHDSRRTMPRFASEHWQANLELRERVRAIATREGLSLPRFALAWLLTRAPHVVPIPGTTRVEHLADNLGAASLRLRPAVMDEIDQVVNPKTVSGARYGEHAAADSDTEQFE